MSVCVFVRIFLGHFETHWDDLWHKAAFWSYEGSKTTIVVFEKTEKNCIRCAKKTHIILTLLVKYLDQLGTNFDVYWHKVVFWS